MLAQALTLHLPMTKRGPLPVSQQMHCISHATLSEATLSTRPLRILLAPPTSLGSCLCSGNKLNFLWLILGVVRAFCAPLPVPHLPRKRKRAMSGGLGMIAAPLSSLGMHGVSRERICCLPVYLLSPLSLTYSFSISSFLGLGSGALVFVLAKEETSGRRKGCQKLPGGVCGAVIGHCH